jgi:hypothetical protein
MDRNVGVGVARSVAGTFARHRSEGGTGTGFCERLDAAVSIEGAPLAAVFLGISSGAGFAMIGATLTTRLAQYGIKKSAVTIFALTFLAYNFKFLWAPPVDNGSSSIPSRRQQRSRLSPQLFA